MDFGLYFLGFRFTNAFLSLRPDAFVQDHDRVTQMETRLVVAEQSNRALLDEVLRLQGQLQSAVRASQDALAAERKSRDQLEAVLIRFLKRFER